MKTTLLTMLVLSAGLVLTPTALADHCTPYDFAREIICRVFAAVDEILPPIHAAPPAPPTLP